MSSFSKRLNDLDLLIVHHMHKWGFVALRYSLGIVFFWFGLLKPLGLSPAADLVANTVFFFDPQRFIPILGWWEVAIGVGLIYRPLLRVAIFLLFLQMPGTFLPIFLLPEVVFTQFPHGLTLEGQYIIKNLTLIAAAIVVGGTVRSRSSKDEVL